MNNKVLIAAHRGTFGGNIIQNTITAYENAIKHGADIIEIDVTKTIDGQFVAFHTGEEPFLLGTHIPLASMTLEQVKNLSLYNNIGQLTDQKLNLLDDILEHFRNRCFINIDRSWQYWSNIINVIKDHNMSEQVILKSPFSNALSEKAEDNKVMYMPIVDNINVLELVLSSKNKILGAELVFNKDNAEIVSDSYIHKIRSKSSFLWGNAINIDDKTILSGKHDDFISITQSADQGWGWLIKKGFNIIQTDWPALLSNYINSRTYR